MIKTQVLVKRKAGMSREAFADYWLTVHVAITAKIPEIKRQTISIVRSDLERSDTPWDGLANAWWDGADAIAAARKGDAYRAMIADEANFVDTSTRQPLVVCEVNPLAPKQPPHPDPNLIKVVNPLHKRDDLSYDAFSAYWRGPHAALNSELPHMNAYIQNHVHPDFQAVGRACDGIAESWFNSWEEVLDITRSDAYLRLKEDEPKLIAPGHLHPMICREYQTI